MRQNNSRAIIIHDVHDTLLGGLTPSVFLKRHWHRLPLLVRGAIPNFNDLLNLRKLRALATRDDCEARLVIGNDANREVLYSPLPARIFRDLPEREWTLLVQSVDHFVPDARQLLNQFSFVPHARMDDLMVSYAAPGGGVGAHFDSYDVFLLQGSGSRSWQVSAQDDLELVADSELKILKRFRPTGKCILDSGDMLYLPPRIAHNGVALNACMTYSVGFRAPDYADLKSQFLAFLDDHIEIDGRYQDAGLAVSTHAGEIGGKMLADISKALSAIRWGRSTILDFIGCYLSEPKRHVVLRQPPAVSFRQFADRIRGRGVELHPALQLLYRGNSGFINGNSFEIKKGERMGIVRLADQRCLSGHDIRTSKLVSGRLHDWYRDGYICVGTWGEQ